MSNQKYKLTSDRRNVLKTIGAGAGALSTFPMGTQAANGSQRYHGVVYNSVTHEILGGATGEFEQADEEQMHGTLRLSPGGTPQEYQINVEQPTQVETLPEGGARYEQYYPDQAPPEKPNYIPSVALSTYFAESLTGCVKVPADDSLSRLAFALQREDKGRKRDVHQRVRAAGPNNKNSNQRNQNSSEKVGVMGHGSGEEYHHIAKDSISGNNDYDEDGWSWLMSYNADNTDDTNGYDQICVNSDNRHQWQMWFDDLPTYDQSTDNDDCNYVTFDSYRIEAYWDYATSGENQNINALRDTAEPTESSKWAASFSLGPSFGAWSAGISTEVLSYQPNQIYHNSHNHIKWDFNSPGGWPDDQKNCVGARVDVDAGGTERTEWFKMIFGMSWQYWNRGCCTCNGGSVVYTDQSSKTLYPSIVVTGC